MLLIYLDEQALNDAARDQCYQQSAQLARELEAKGQYLAAAPLYPTSTATSVRVRDGKRLVTDGPFAETREQLGGYFLIDAKDLDEALRVAARIPGASTGTVEVRPVLEIANVPPDHSSLDPLRSQSAGEGDSTMRPECNLVSSIVSFIPETASATTGVALAEECSFFNLRRVLDIEIPSRRLKS